MYVSGHTLIIEYRSYWGSFVLFRKGRVECLQQSGGGRFAEDFLWFEPLVGWGSLNDSMKTSTTINLFFFGATIIFLFVCHFAVTIMGAACKEFGFPRPFTVKTI